ncbi:hypothetical protein [Timonella sp. A28]|uniref:hypothetical protein n=1 Tax=Timonella sp. A28 TaxID=3442640 RepID=UPI003EBFEE5A
MAKDKRPYAQIDVGWYMNPKWYQVERFLLNAMPDAMPDALLHALQDAKQLHLVSILYSAQARWDGRFPVSAIKAFARTRYEESVSALFDCGMWINHSGGMAEIHDYLQHQASAAELDAATSKAKKAAEARWNNASSNASSNAKRIPPSNASSNAEKRREEKRNIEVPKGTSSSRKKASTPFPEQWQPTDTHHAKAKENGLDLHRETEKFKAHALANDRRQVDWNQAFTQWLLKASEYQTRSPNGGGFSRPSIDRQGELLKAERARILNEMNQQPRLEIEP